MLSRKLRICRQLWILGGSRLAEEKAALIAEIWEMMKKLNQEFAERYPVLGMSGRPLLAEQEADIPSVETYQCSELETYSMQTLQDTMIG